MTTNQDNLPSSLIWGSHLVGLGTLAVALVLGFVLVHLPLAKERRGYVESIAEIDRLLARSESITQLHEKVSGRHVELQGRVQETLRRIPPSPPETEFLSEAMHIAEEESLRIVDYQPGAGRKLETHCEVEVVLRCIGGYDAICGFLERISQLPRQSAVRQMVVHSKEGRDIYPFEITLVLFYGLHRSDQRQLARRDVDGPWPAWSMDRATIRRFGRPFAEGPRATSPETREVQS